MKYTDRKYRRQSSSSSLESENLPPIPMKSKNDSNHTDDLSKNAHSKSNLENQQSLSKCKRGDRVRFYDKQHRSSEGTVKWIGTSSGSRKFSCIYVGIITVSNPPMV